MARQNYNDLLAFVSVARERSFTRAAALLGVSQSALSHTIRGLESRLGLRLLTRTTRSVAPTEAGERLLASIGSRFDEIDAELQALTALRDKPAGTVRITTGEHALESILWPKLARLLPAYPDVKLELDVSYGLKDIVAERFDAGVRMGEQVEKDMVAVRIGPPMRMAAVGAPAYFAGHPRPREPQDLAGHRCINLRLPTYGGLYAWEFERGRRAVNVRVDGQLVFNDITRILTATLDGFGVAYLPEDMVLAHMRADRLLRVLEDWCPPSPATTCTTPAAGSPRPPSRWWSRRCAIVQTVDAVTRRRLTAPCHFHNFGIMEMTSALAVLGALGHESRLAAFRELVQAGPDGLSVGALRERLGLPPATLTAHLNVLRTAALVQDQREGRVIRVRAGYAQMEALIAYLTENCCAGNAACGPPPACQPSRKRAKP